MFTGLIISMGTLTEVPSDAKRRVRIVPAEPGFLPVAMGASIAVSGICLTVTEQDATSFSAQLSPETLGLTTSHGWKIGDKVNLEASLKIGDTLGGHLVSGHVDGMAEILSVTPADTSWRIELRVPKALAKFIAQKGSVTLDGISLTVNEVTGDTFSVMIIPHTAEVTTIGARVAGDKVNLEIDMLARYVERLIGAA